MDNCSRFWFWLILKINNHCGRLNTVYIFNIQLSAVFFIICSVYLVSAVCIWCLLSVFVVCCLYLVSAVCIWCLLSVFGVCCLYLVSAICIWCLLCAFGVSVFGAICLYFVSTVWICCLLCFLWLRHTMTRYYVFMLILKFFYLNEFINISVQVTRSLLQIGVCLSVAR